MNRILTIFAKRHTYTQPVAGWTAWYELFGRCVAFESVDGKRLYRW